MNILAQALAQCWLTLVALVQAIMSCVHQQELANLIKNTPVSDLTLEDLATWPPRDIRALPVDAATLDELLRLRKKHNDRRRKCKDPIEDENVAAFVTLSADDLEINALEAMVVEDEIEAWWEKFQQDVKFHFTKLVNCRQTQLFIVNKLRDFCQKK